MAGVYFVHSFHPEPEDESIAVTPPRCGLTGLARQRVCHFSFILRKASESASRFSRISWVWPGKQALGQAIKGRGRRVTED